MKAPRLLLGVLCACLLLGAGPQRPIPFGYVPANGDRERLLESTFLDLPSAQSALNLAEQIAASPHFPGSPGDRSLASWMADRLREAGFDAALESFDGEVDTPRRLGLRLFPNSTATPEPLPSGVPRPRVRRSRGPASITIDLREPALPADEQTAGAPLPYFAGSGDGDVTAPLAYVGRGLDADYADLAQHNVAVSGAVVLIRAGAQFRGTLAARAQARGARGAIIFNDPADDGFVRGAVYPNGPWRAPTSVERGTLGSGIKIPVLPVSAANAQILLATLVGPPGGPEWTGGLASSYPYARGPATVRLTVSLTRREVTMWNTVGRIRGTRGDQSVIFGAHRDAWIRGAGDKGSGLVTMLEIARGFSYLLQNGWKPSRTIVFAGWDGEEMGNLGSLAYVKRHGDELRNGGVAYLNADENVLGPHFSARGASALNALVTEITRSVPDPGTPRRSLFDQWAEESQVATPELPPPGGGSDQASFLFGLGMPVAMMTFGGPFGGYHSAYDTLRFAREISDPEFVRHRSAAQIYGALVMRLADADAVPYSFGSYATTLAAGLDALKNKALNAAVGFEPVGLNAATQNFIAVAARFDSATALGTNAPAAERALEAARILDQTLYGADGSGALYYPKVQAAMSVPDAPDLDAAVAAARAAIDRAAQLLAEAPGTPTASPPPTATPIPRRTPRPRARPQPRPSRTPAR